MPAPNNQKHQFSAAATAIIKEATTPFHSTDSAFRQRGIDDRKLSVMYDLSRRDSSISTTGLSQFTRRSYKKRSKRGGLLTQTRNSRHASQIAQQQAMDSLTQKGSLTEDDLHELREIFKLVDVDDSGDISREELFQLMKQIGLNPTMEQVNDMMSEVDADNNGTIDFHEFVLCMTSKSKAAFGLEQILAAFKVFDPEGKGYVTVDKLEHILTHYGEGALSIEETTKLINTLDTERKGKLYYQKYCTIHSS